MSLSTNYGIKRTYRMSVSSCTQLTRRCSNKFAPRLKGSNHLPRNVSESVRTSMWLRSQPGQAQQPVSWQAQRKWWNTPGLQAVKHKGPFIVPSTDYHKLSSVRNTLWGEGTEAYTSADNPHAWGGSHDIMCVFIVAFAGTLAFKHTHTHTNTLTDTLYRQDNIFSAILQPNTEAS